jgi:hypothetical protein
MNSKEIGQSHSSHSTERGEVCSNAAGIAASNALPLAKALGRTADALRGEVGGFLVEIRLAWSAVIEISCLHGAGCSDGLRAFTNG